MQRDPQHDEGYRMVSWLLLVFAAAWSAWLVSNHC